MKLDNQLYQTKVGQKVLKVSLAQILDFCNNTEKYFTKKIFKYNWISLVEDSYHHLELR